MPLPAMDYVTTDARIGSASTVRVIRDQLNGRDYTGTGGRRMALYTEDGQLSLGFNIALREIDFDGFAWEWAQLDRVGGVAKMVPKWGQLRTLKFDTLITSRLDMYANMQTFFNQFRQICRSTQRIMVRYSRQEIGSFAITAGSMKSVVRDPVTNDITRAEISMTLTEHNEGPKVGASSLWYASVPTSRDRPSSNGRPRIDVRPGDTLQSLSLRAYGSVNDWMWLYALNSDRLATPWADLTGVLSLAV